jgi:predicted ATPase/DNA-binding XRE family transcriptional regulator
MNLTPQSAALASPSPLGALVKRYRAAAGLSQEALAERAQLSARAVSDLERGLRHAPHLGTIELLAEALTLAPPQRALLLAAARPEMAGVAAADATPPLPVALPSPPTALIGRTNDLAESRALLTTSHGRLLTIVGPGGVGKTRLCLALARDLAPNFADGVAFVALAPVREAAQLSGAVAQALRLRESTSAAEAVREALGERHVLLVLDNCEHLPGVAAFVADLLEACPRVVVLASSRGPLRLRAEQQLPLAPLPLADAVTLFRERARAASLRAVLAEPEVAALCRRLDCLPLALELAAAHVGTLTPALILAQLDRGHQGLGLLGDGPRDLPTRQQTMRDAIGWSYDLLTLAQRRCLRALAVFTGGWTLEAALAVCRDGAEDEGREGVLTLAALVDASLVRAERTPEGDARFSLLELTRDYVLTCPREAGEWERVRERHARYYARLVQSVGMLAAWQGAAVARYLPDVPNVVAALAWAEERRDAPLAMALLDVGHVWHVSGQVSPPLYWVERVLALDAAARASGAPAAALPLRVKHLYGLARVLASGGQMDRAMARADESERLAREIGDQAGLSNALGSRGQIALATGHADAAERDFEASYAAAVASGDAALTGQALFFRAQSARVRGELERAMTLLEEAAALAAAEGNAWSQALAATLLGQIEHQRGQHAAALARYREALPLFGAFHTPNFTAWCLEGAAAAFGALGEHARATRLLAAADALRHEARMPPPPAEQAAAERVSAAARAALGEATWAEAHAAGAALTLESAIADALITIDPSA